MITDQEQAVLFKTEEFAAAARLFNRLARIRPIISGGKACGPISTRPPAIWRCPSTSSKSRCEGGDSERLQPHPARRPSVQWQPQRGIAGPWGLAEMRRILDRIELEFSNWR